jgi:DNA-binding response OmpR family regulator
VTFTVMGKNRRTVLLVDQDPQFRAGLRVALEAAGFLVGEAANGKEGERTALRIRPDAILLELMLEAVDSGSVMAHRLREVGEKFPIFIISSAADAIYTDLNLDELGVAGAFGKPVDPQVVINTLRTRLSLRG